MSPHELLLKIKPIGGVLCLALATQMHGSCCLDLLQLLMAAIALEEFLPVMKPVDFCFNHYITLNWPINQPQTL
jgi:hypothetical protein